MTPSLAAAVPPPPMPLGALPFGPEPVSAGVPPPPPVAPGVDLLPHVKMQGRKEHLNELLSKKQKERDIKEAADILDEPIPVNDPFFKLVMGLLLVGLVLAVVYVLN